MKEKEFCHFCSEPLIIRYFEGRDRLYCNACDQPIYENPIPATAAVVFNEKGEILLGLRNREPKIGEWCLPGGFVENDESPEQACLRELKEETNLEAEIMSPEGNFPGHSPVYKAVVILGYQLKNVRGELKAGDDCDEVRYFSLDNMPRLAFRSHRSILQHALRHRPPVQAVQSIPVDGCFGAYVITSSDHVDIARRACEGGARILQYRDKKATRKEMIAIAHEIRSITRKHKTLFIINDYIDIAILVGADGVHLGQDDIPVTEARTMVPPGFIIGLSTHSLQQAKEAEKLGVDYIGSGPVFATPTKEHYVPIGVDTLKEVLNTVKLPVVAIGGLNLENFQQIRGLGAQNVAMVRAFQKETTAVVSHINKLLLET